MERSLCSAQTRRLKTLLVVTMSVLLFTLAASPAAAAFSQQGAKLVGTGAANPAQQGSSVAVSADGNTAVVGGFTDNSSFGAAWVYTRSAGVWSQQGLKLVAAGSANTAQQGSSVAVSADGNTAFVGGSNDNGGAGAAWVYTRDYEPAGAVWSQQARLFGTGASGAARQGTSVAVSADGSTAVVGGYSDNSGAGAAWVYFDSTVPVELSRFTVE